MTSEADYVKVVLRYWPNLCCPKCGEWKHLVCTGYEVENHADKVYDWYGSAMLDHGDRIYFARLACNKCRIRFKFEAEESY